MTAQSIDDLKGEERAAVLEQPQELYELYKDSTTAEGPLLAYYIQRCIKLEKLNRGWLFFNAIMAGLVVVFGIEALT